MLEQIDKEMNPLLAKVEPKPNESFSVADRNG